MRPGPAFGAYDVRLNDGDIREVERLLNVTAVDPTDTMRPRSLVELQPEQRLMLDILWTAIIDSHSRKTLLSGPARAWLRDQPGFTARECCEYIGLDYDAVMTAMERQWSR
jgi:hypothetical protein